MKSFQFSSFKTLFCAALLTTAFLTGCSDDDKVTKLAVSKSKVEVAVGVTSEKINILGGTQPYKVESSSKETATVAASTKEFTIKGVKKGSAIITVKDKEGKTTTVNVTVIEKAAK